MLTYRFKGRVRCKPSRRVSGRPLWPWLGLLLFVGGCFGSTVPSPPDGRQRPTAPGAGPARTQDQPEVPPGVAAPRLDQLGFSEPATAFPSVDPLPDGRVITVRGEPGAVPPLATVWAVGIFSTADPVTAAAAADGSFSLRVAVGGPPTFRLQTRLPSGRSVPIDLDAASLPPVPLVSDGCLVFALELDFGAVAQPTTRGLTIENACAAPVEIAAAPRVTLPGIEVVSGPQTIAPGETGELNVTYTPGTPVDDLIRVTVSGALAETRAVNVLGSAL